MRRSVLVILLFGLVFSLPQTAAQTFPTKNVHFIIPYPPGGPVDDVGRVVGQRLSELWGQTVVVENRSGSNGSIGTEFVARSQADGYTLLVGNSGPITVNPLIKRLRVDPQKDLEPVTIMVTSPQVLVVSPKLPVNSVKDLVALAASRPGDLNYASSGVGNIQHLAMEEFQSVAGIRMNHVPYKGTAPAYIDLIAGRVDAMIGNTVGALNYIQAGSMRALAVTSERRLPQLANLPAIAETFPGFETTAWMGLFAPKGVPESIIRKIQADVAKVLARPDMQERFAAQGAEVVASTPEQLRDLMQKEAALWARVIRTAGIKTE